MSLKGRRLRRTGMVEGWSASWTWATPAGAVPTGVSVDHGDHQMVVQWADADSPDVLFTLDSLVPLTVVEEVRCQSCNRAGSIVDGVWVPRPEGGADVG